MNKKLELITFNRNTSIREVMEGIDKSSLRIALIVDKDKKLSGVITDGDIRRALLAGKKIDSVASEIMHLNPIVVPEGTPATEILELMLKKDIFQVPVVDVAGRAVDLALFSELKTIPLSSPDITHKEVEIINQVLATPFLSIGPKINQFEEKIADYTGTRYAVAVNSGTSALHLCIRSLDIKEGDEVITTPFSFIASANCILFEKAKPVFVDIEEDTLCLDADKIEEKITPKTKAILPVHVFGQPCKMDKITSVARKHNLSVIEDACEAIGAQYKHKKVGSFGDAGVFAFYPNKQITTAEGGMIVTDDEKIAKLCRSMRNQGREDDTDWLCHKRLGYNYRMSELSAALGVAQVERIDEILEKRQKVAGSYNERLQAIEGIIVPHAPGDARISWFVYVIRLDVGKFSLEDRNRIMQRLRERGISCSNYFPPIHLEPLYIELFGYKGGDFPVTEAVSRSTISLPFFNNLNKNDIEYTCNTLRDIIRRPYG